MRLPPLELAGLLLSALLCFLLSLFYIIVSYYSRLGFSRLLGQVRTETKQKVLDHYDELKSPLIMPGCFSFWLYSLCLSSLAKS